MRLRRLTISFFAAAGAVSCGGGSSAPATPTPVVVVAPPVPSCQANNTGQITFINHSVSNTTYDVIWDGGRLTTLTPGQSSQAYTVAAAQHTATFLVTNSSIVACVTGTPVIAQCTTTASLTCSR